MARNVDDDKETNLQQFDEDNERSFTVWSTMREKKEHNAWVIDSGC